MNETIFGALASMVRFKDDERWQFPLAWHPHLDELAAYHEPGLGAYFPGTIEIAKSLGIRHPTIRDGKKTSLWPMTTDLVVTLRPPLERRQLLPLSSKDKPFRELSPRDRSKLAIDAEYWNLQSHPWLLITPETYSHHYALAVLGAFNWIKNSPAESDEQCKATAEIVRSISGRTFTTSFGSIGQELKCDPARAKTLFWQTVWRGLLPIDITLSHWLPNPVRIISQEAFCDANPILARRSAWPS
jgi:hypothetical protein